MISLIAKSISLAQTDKSGAGRKFQARLLLPLSRARLSSFITGYYAIYRTRHRRTGGVAPLQLALAGGPRGPLAERQPCSPDKRLSLSGFFNPQPTISGKAWLPLGTPPCRRINAKIDVPQNHDASIIENPDPCCGNRRRVACVQCRRSGRRWTLASPAPCDRTRERSDQRTRERGPCEAARLVAWLR